MAIKSEEVVLAAEQIQATGESPTIEKIRYLLGAGSNTTISKHLKNWRDNRSMVKSSVTAPPDQVQAAVSAVWEKLHQETQSSIDAIKAEAKEQVAVARNEAEAAHAALSMLQTEHEALKTQYYALSAQKELLALDYKQAQGNLQLLHERYNTLESHHQEVKSVHQHELKRLEDKCLTEIERITSHTEREVQLARQLADTLKSHYEDARLESMRQLDQLKVENKKNDAAIKRLEVDKVGLKNLLEAKITQHQQLTVQLTEAQAFIQLQQAQLDKLQNKRFVTEEIITAFEALPMRVADELRVHLAEQVNDVIDLVAKVIQSKQVEIEHV